MIPRTDPSCECLSKLSVLRFTEISHQPYPFCSNLVEVFLILISMFNMFYGTEKSEVQQGWPKCGAWIPYCSVPGVSEGLRVAGCGVNRAKLAPSDISKMLKNCQSCLNWIHLDHFGSSKCSSFVMNISRIEVQVAIQPARGHVSVKVLSTGCPVEEFSNMKHHCTVDHIDMVLPLVCMMHTIFSIRRYEKFLEDLAVLLLCRIPLLRHEGTGWTAMKGC